MRDVIKKPVVLIVDDVPKNIQVVGHVLKESGVDCSLSFANNGRDALRSIAKVHPDLILLDVMMPAVGGFEVCQALKADESTKNIPVIFLTAKVEEEDIVKGFELGAVDYITKPFNSLELVARVKTQLALKEKSDLVNYNVQEFKQLLHVMCHDLMNPILAASYFLEECIEEDIKLSEDPELKQLFKQSIGNSIEIIDSVRKVRALEENKIALKLKAYSLSSLLEESLNLIKPRFQEKNIFIDNQIEGEFEVYVEKALFVNSILNNVFTNALKFSPRDGVIYITANKQDGLVNLSICDNGIGIPESLLANLFDYGKMISRPGTEGESGTGFGMSLMKKFVEAFGGEIEVLSRDVESYPNDSGTDICISLKSDI